ncbi:hypothetical protein C8F01DRAFT_1166640 [Mycena amicta]|nr:hypothetical protein C8F01DRAFT_1166640 [Mycena amicta]
MACVPELLDMPTHWPVIQARVHLLLPRQVQRVCDQPPTGSMNCADWTNRREILATTLQVRAPIAEMMNTLRPQNSRRVFVYRVFLTLIGWRPLRRLQRQLKLIPTTTLSSAQRALGACSSFASTSPNRARHPAERTRTSTVIPGLSSMVGVLSAEQNSRSVNTHNSSAETISSVSAKITELTADVDNAGPETAGGKRAQGNGPREHRAQSADGTSQAKGGVLSM